ESETERAGSETKEGNETRRAQGERKGNAGGRGAKEKAPLVRPKIERREIIICPHLNPLPGQGEEVAKRQVRVEVQPSGTSFHFIFPLAISSQATLAGEPWFGRAMQPGFKNNTPPRFSFRGTWV